MDKVYDALRNDGIEINGNIDFHKDGFQRFSLKGKKAGKKDFFVIISRDSASYGDWSDRMTWKTVFFNDTRKTYEEKYARVNEDIQRRKDKEMQHDKIAKRCEKFFKESKYITDNIEHEYVKKKRIHPYYARQFRKTVVIPMRDINYKIQSLQFIKPDGFKMFKRGSKIQGSMAFLCNRLSVEYSGAIYICEGWATGCTIKEATMEPVICSMSAGALVDTAILIRNKYPNSTIHICADNDFKSKENIGLKYGKKAVETVNGFLLYPIFDLGLDEKVSDFNDLLCKKGFDEVEKQLRIVG